MPLMPEDDRRREDHNEARAEIVARRIDALRLKMLRYVERGVAPEEVACWFYGFSLGVASGLEAQASGLAAHTPPMPPRIPSEAGTLEELTRLLRRQAWEAGYRCMDRFGNDVGLLMALQGDELTGFAEGRGSPSLAGGVRLSRGPMPERVRHACWQRYQEGFMTAFVLARHQISL